MYCSTLLYWTGFPIEAGLWALREGLKLDRRSNLQGIEVAIDASAAIDLIMGKFTCTQKY